MNAMKNPLTEQKMIIKLQSFYKKRMRMPSYSEAAELFGLLSKESAYRQIQKLIQAKVLKKDSEGKLLPGQLFNIELKHPGLASTLPRRGIAKIMPQQTYSEVGIPLLGLVEAGFPSEAEQDELDIVSLDNWLIKSRADSFMLQVKGDSMMDAGIYSGDHVVVSKSKQARLGDIVIARLDGGMTMKYLRQKGNQLYLQPANQSFSDMYPERELEVQAVVTAVIRRFD